LYEIRFEINKTKQLNTGKIKKKKRSESAVTVLTLGSEFIAQIPLINKQNNMDKKNVVKKNLILY